jgi:hypothetical protein
MKHHLRSLNSLRRYIPLTLLSSLAQQVHSNRMFIVPAFPTSTLIFHLFSRTLVVCLGMHGTAVGRYYDHISSLVASIPPCEMMSD